MTNIAEAKFEECRECLFFRNRSNACRRCEIGENFEPRIHELDPDKLELEAREGDDDE